MEPEPRLAELMVSLDSRDGTRTVRTLAICEVDVLSQEQIRRMLRTAADNLDKAVV